MGETLTSPFQHFSAFKKQGKILLKCFTGLLSSARIFFYSIESYYCRVRHTAKKNRKRKDLEKLKLETINLLMYTILFAVAEARTCSTFVYNNWNNYSSHYLFDLPINVIHRNNSINSRNNNVI